MKRSAILLAKVTGVLLLAASMTACQVLSGSVKSISDSVTGISDSIGGSIEGSLRSSGSDKGGGSSAARYQEDVRLATASFVREGRDEAGFLRDLGRLAERHGIADWESHDETLRGIGAGACEAGLAPFELDALLVRLGQSGDARRGLAHEGWRSASL